MLRWDPVTRKGEHVQRPWVGQKEGGPDAWNPEREAHGSMTSDGWDRGRRQGSWDETGLGAVRMLAESSWEDR